MVGHNSQDLFLSFGTDHEITICPRIPATHLSIGFARHGNYPLS